MAKLANLHNTDRPRSIFKIFWFIIKLAWKSNKWVFLGAVFTILAMVSFQFIGSFGFSKVIDALTINPSWAKVMPWLILVVVVDYIPSAVGFLRTTFTEYLDRSLRMNLEQIVNRKLTNLDVATIEQPDFQDLFYQVHSRGVTGIIQINFWFFDLIQSGSRIILALLILFTITKLGLLILVVSAIPIYFYESWKAKRLGALLLSQAESNRKAFSRLSAFNGKDTLIEIKLFNLADYFLSKIKKIRLTNHDEVTKDDKQTLPWFAGTQMVTNVGILIALSIVLGDVIKGVRSLGTLTFTWGTLWTFTSAFQAILRAIGRLREHGIHASKLINMLEIEPFVPENNEGIKYDVSIPPTVEFQNVSFAYPGSKYQVLTDLNVTFSAKSETALVGLNGAGKTTLLRLVSRVYDPTSGVILVNGIDLREYSLSSWRDSLGIMLQDYWVYQDETIGDNITFTPGKEDKKLLAKVTAQTGVAQFAGEYPKGLDQMIGKEYQGGAELSKGQKQKLALARALYQNHPFLILDEPTAAIDALSEDYIFKALRNEHTDKTRIIISHKFSNVRDADKIILVEHGKIIEQGSHNELMTLNREYAKLFNLQAEGYR